jgi:hypothetical protein
VLHHLVDVDHRRLFDQLLRTGIAQAAANRLDELESWFHVVSRHPLRAWQQALLIHAPSLGLSFQRLARDSQRPGCR